MRPPTPTNGFSSRNSRNFLDEATKTKLRGRQRQNPNLTLTDFRRELRKEFGVDAHRQNRRDWEGVTLRLTGPPGHELTQQEWRRFEALYKLHRDTVPERSASEEWRMLFVKLPPNLQEQIIREQTKRREKRPWVRVTFPSDLDPTDVLTAVQMHTQHPLPRYHECSQGFVFETPTEEDQEDLLSLHRAKVEGIPLTVSQKEYEMTADKILNFISKRLRSEAELQAARDALGCTRPASTPTQPTNVQPEKPGVANLQLVQFDAKTAGSRPKGGGCQNLQGGQTQVTHVPEGSG